MPRSALLVGLIVVSALAGCADNSVVTIKMAPGHRFEPKSVEVSAGTTIQWVNASAESHTVTAAEGALPDGAEYFASGGFEDEVEALDNMAGGLLDEGDTYEVTFDVPGNYAYYCIPHSGDPMTGTIRVTED
ncbi:MAG TPA: plastocyanin/azurin family copper-binding protein [Actinomycetota bacterium]|nr:plastocyanin/azurin family copper-binding protein [Actinomycetota bacterium]